MALARAYEEDEVGSDLRRIYGEVRTQFDLPFVPTVFKVLAGVPDYLRPMWGDLRPIVASREFQSASRALGEFATSQAIFAGGHFKDQHKTLASQKFSTSDAEVIASVAAIFGKAIPELALFCRLLQLGYSGGQSGRVTGAKQAGALSRWFSLHIPRERDAGLRAWLIYSDIRKTLGTRHVFSVFRAVSPYPGYLAAIWVETKKLLEDPAFHRSSDEIARRTRSLLSGLPVRDHRKLAKALSPVQWREVEETVDGFARTLPQMILFSAVWKRSFRLQGLGGREGVA